ncbi:flavodoxin family protein [Proteiniphilum sp. X52]|uniref:flavodoxin family protein n=1 Tax=Proteiniphilum sp. X52 TaxID=2382159 RepID=UPI001628C6C1|nr:flavodoxin family protein [Proteiniphilum sp. X52]
MDRREFIKKSGVAAAGTLLDTTPFASMLAKDDKKNNGMKIVVLTGSPRKNGNTNHMADEFIRGAKEAGHEVFRFNTATSDVHSCLGCNHCGMDGPCVYEDDFTKVLRPEIIKADLVVFCSPMYYFGFSAQLKATIDRFYAINGTLHTRKKCVFLMAYANMSKKDAEAMTAHYKTIADYMGWEDVGCVIAPGIWTAGSIKGTKYAKESYELGKLL